MRKLFLDCKCRKTAWKRAPWAAKIIKVEGGFRAYENLSDFEIDQKQT